MKKLLVLIFVCLMAVFSVGCGFVYEREYYRDSAVVFGTDLTLDAWLLGRNSPRAFLEMADELKAIDADISLTRAGSSLARLNAAAVGEPIECGKHAYTLLNLANQFYEETEGAFHAAVVDLSALWGVDAGASTGFGQMRETPLPEYKAVASAASAIGTLKRNTGTAFGVTGYVSDGKYYLKKLDAAAKLDFGAVAKGYAADCCVEIAKTHKLTSAIIDLSGNIKTFGQFRDESGALSPFTVSVTDPRSYGMRGAALKERLFVLSVPETEQSVVVSGDYERYYVYAYGQEDTVPVCHIINPFNGMPLGIDCDGDRYYYSGENTVISAVIADESSAFADAVSTAVCVMGYERGVRFLQEQGIYGAVMTETELTFVGIRADKLYKPDEYGTFARYETVQFAEFI